MVGSLEEPPNIWLTVAKNRICLLTFEFRSPHVIERRSKDIDNEILCMCIATFA